MVRHLTADELHAGLEAIRRSPADRGTLDLIVSRPAVGEREVLDAGELTPETGLQGDTWGARVNPRRPDAADPDTQITLMNSRTIALVAGDRSRWPLAGDQLFVDLDLSAANLPPGTRLAIGEAELEVTAEPHTGCAKFVSRYGVDAMKFVNSPIGRQLRLRGIYARVMRAGRIRAGDVILKVPAAAGV